MSISTGATVDPARVGAEELEALRRAALAFPEDSQVGAMLSAVLSAAERGITVTTVTEERELTPNEAAHIAGMSRPHLMTFVRNNALKASKVGTHHRIAFADLLDFLKRRESAAQDVASAVATRPQSPSVELSPEELAELDQL